MKVLLINPATKINARATTCPLGLLSIASYLQTKGYIVKIVDQTVKKENIDRHMKSFNPDVVGVTVLSYMSAVAAVKVSKTIRKYNKPIAWGGQLISALPELGFREGCVDYIVISEGEITFHQLLLALEKGGSLGNIDGLAYLEGNAVRINPPREFADLSAFPKLDWSLVNAKKYTQAFFGCTKMLYVYASKGCPASCTFCVSRKYHRSKHRRRPIEDVVDEIEYLINWAGIDSINFADEFWCPTAEERQKFYHLIKEKKLNFVWGVQTRLGTFKKDDLQQMYDAGCRWILFGLESGCAQRIDKIKKGIDLGKAKEIFDSCREIGITSQSAFIIGFPDETEEELKETIRFAQSLHANLCPFSILYLQPGSEMLEATVSQGKFRVPKSLKEWSKINMTEQINANLSKVPRRELKVVHYYTQWAAFADKRSVNTDSFGIAKKMTIDALRKMFRFGPYSFFAGAFISIKQFFTVLWYAKAYPRIVKKYGLRK